MKLDVEVWQTNAGDYIAEVITPNDEYLGYSGVGSTEEEALSSMRAWMRDRLT